MRNGYCLVYILLKWVKFLKQFAWRNYLSSSNYGQQHRFFIMFMSLQLVFGINSGSSHCFLLYYTILVTDQNVRLIDCKIFMCKIESFFSIFLGLLDLSCCGILQVCFWWVMRLWYEPFIATGRLDQCVERICNTLVSLFLSISNRIIILFIRLYSSKQN